MGVTTISAARIYQGQLEGQPGEENILEMEKFPYVALSKVNSAVNLLQHPHGLLSDHDFCGSYYVIFKYVLAKVCPFIAGSGIHCTLITPHYALHIYHSSLCTLYTQSTPLYI